MLEEVLIPPRWLYLFHALQIKLHEDAGALKNNVFKNFTNISWKAPVLETLRRATL